MTCLGIESWTEGAQSHRQLTRSCIVAKEESATKSIKTHSNCNWTYLISALMSSQFRFRLLLTNSWNLKELELLISFLEQR